MGQTYLMFGLVGWAQPSFVFGFTGFVGPDSSPFVFQNKRYRF
jgi:hypothetical protein